MKISVIHMEEVDSTSSQAAKLLRDGRSAPFAVASSIQTAGRGRRGRDWQSPSGNLYITIALPSPSSPEAISTVPIKTAGIVASWLESEFGFRCTVKWPNDLLFAGRKLGGILCESSTTGAKQGEFLIGVGINIANSPVVPSPVIPSERSERRGSQLPTSVSEITGDKSLDPVKLADQFADHFSKLWNETDLELFSRYDMERGHLWTKKESQNAKECGVYKGIDSGGKLVLSSIAGDKPDTVISSADHDYSWIYHCSKAADFPLLVADIGNTNIKIGLFKSACDETLVCQTLSNSSATPSDLDELMVFLKEAKGVNGWPVFTVSVSEPGLEKFVELCRDELTPVILQKRPVRWRDGGYDLNGLGIDRLAAIEAWLSRAGTSGDKAKTGVVVSSGTATTVDIVKASGEHLGGVIFPGMQTGLDSLNAAATLLPSLKAGEIEDVVNKAVGANTKEAMEQGALQMTLGAIERIIDFHASEHGVVRKDIEVCLTGGNALLLGPSLGAVPKSDLVLQGAKVMALGGFLA